MSRKPDIGRIMLFAVAALVAIVLGGSLSILIFGPPGGQRGVASGSLGTIGEALIGGPFELTDHRGRPVDESLLEGRPSLIYFGFTYCPDFCPAELANMAAAKEAMAARGRDVQLLFVTIDPDRDDQQTLAEYVEAFDADMIGLRGDAAQTRAAAQAYKVFYRKVEGEDFVDGYTMDHSTFLYAMDASGRFITQFSYGSQPEEIADRLIGASAN